MKINLFPMQPHYRNRIYISFILIIGVLFFLGSLQAQEINTLLADTTVKEPQTIKISEISIRSSQVVLKTNRAYEALLSDKEIEKLGQKSDSIVFLYDSMLTADLLIELEDLSNRQLSNKLSFWRQISMEMNQMETSLSEKIKTIDEERFKLNRESLIWNNTRDALTEDDSYGSVLGRIDEMIQYLKDIGNKMEVKSGKLLSMLDRNSELSFSLNEYIEKIEQTQIQNESKIFSRHHNSLFSIDWNNRNNWNPIQPVIQFFREEISQLKKYLVMNITRIIALLVTIAFLLFAFNSMKRQIIDKAEEKNSFLRKQLSKVFAKPWVVAIILGLFSSVLYLPNRPEILKDFIEIIIIFPLFYTVYLLLDKRFAKQLILLVIITILETAIYIFPPDHLLYRGLIFTIAATELGLLWWLIKRFYKFPLSKSFQHKFILLLLIFNFIIVFIGIIGMITGATMLADEAVSVPVFNTFAAMLLFVTALTLGGLIEIGVESPSVRKLNVIRQYGQDLKKKLIRIINIAAVIYWLLVFLGSVRLDRKVISGLSAFINNEIQIGSAKFSLGDVFVFILVIWLSVIISRILQVILEKDVLKKFKLKKGIPFTISLMVRYAIITFGIFLAVSAAGLPIGSLGILIGAFGVGIGFGLQNIFNNLVSGLILLFERPIQIGDTIQVGELMGKVKSIGIRSSNVRTFDGSEVIVPNGQFISQEVINWTLSDHQRRIEVIAGVAYGSDPHKVRDLLMQCLEKHPDIIDDPEPSVYFNDLGESSLDFRILFWTANIGEWLRIRSEVVFMVHDVFKENGIEIPFPQRDLHIKSVAGGTEIIGKEKK